MFEPSDDKSIGVMSAEDMSEILFGSPPATDISAIPRGVKLPELPMPKPR
jgi:hypothetical protein